jgi:ectoine hydroxylase-related dioxygenase (phytanoyl-CoA dioxygenase family)
MNTALTSEQVEFYRDNGFVAHRQFLSSDEVRELKSAVLDSVQQMGRAKLVSEDAEAWQSSDDSKSYYDRVFTQRINLWRNNDAVKRYMLNPQLGAMLRALTGVENLRMWHDQTLIKEPFANPTAWHLDDPYWSFYSRDAISIWIALEDATLENGCMWFVPGSHKLATFENVGIGQQMNALFELYPQMARIDPVAVPMKAGDCSFHNGLTAHGANANMTRGRRIAMTAGYMPDGSTFNGQSNVLPRKYLQTLAPGDVLCNDDWNPIV